MEGQRAEDDEAACGDDRRNAGLFAVQVLALSDEALREKFSQFKTGLADKIAAKDANLQEQIS